jgi:hypothetical protein
VRAQFWNPEDRGSIGIPSGPIAGHIIALGFGLVVDDKSELIIKALG